MKRLLREIDPSNETLGIEPIDTPIEPWRVRLVGGVLVGALTLLAVSSGVKDKLDALAAREQQYYLEAGIHTQLGNDGFAIDTVDLQDTDEQTVTLAIEDETCAFTVTGQADVRVGQVYDVSNYTITDANGVALPAVYQAYEDIIATARTSGMCE